MEISTRRRILKSPAAVVSINPKAEENKRTLQSSLTCPFVSFLLLCYYLVDLTHTSGKSIGEIPEAT
jgi:hypothetical protein